MNLTLETPRVVFRKFGMRPRQAIVQHGGFEHLVLEVTRAERDRMRTKA
jgi:hypothetical protein